MVNALSNDTFVNSQVVKVMDTTEEDTGGGSAPATAGKQEGIITVADSHIYTDESYTNTFTYNGDGQVKWASSTSDSATISGNTIQCGDSGTFILYAEATDNFTAAVATFVLIEI